MSSVYHEEQSSEGSITHWLGLAKAGVGNAVTDLHKRYFEQLMSVAKTKFGNSSRTVADEEDIANSVLETLFRNAANGKFPNLHDRHDLWRLLLTITNQKVNSQKRENLRMKRGSGRVYTMTDLRTSLPLDLEMLATSSDSHEVMAVLSDLCTVLLNRISDLTCRQIAVLKLRGYSNREIAKELDLIPRTVDRKVNIIREKWLREFDLPPDDDLPTDNAEPPE